MAEEIDIDAFQLAADGLVLRPWREDDAAALCEAARESVESVGRWLPWCHASYSLHDAHAWISRCRYDWQAGNDFVFPVFDPPTGELLGSVGLNRLDRVHRSANMGYWVRHSCQHRGIATRAGRQVAAFGFNQGLVRIEIVVLPDNRASARTAMGIGARFEAVARQRLWVNETAHDAEVYGLVRADLALPACVAEGRA